MNLQGKIVDTILTIKFESQATSTFQFMCKHTVVKTCSTPCPEKNGTNNILGITLTNTFLHRMSLW